MSKIENSEKKIDEILARGVGEIIVEEHLKKRMLAGEKLRIKFGIDPTGAVLHLGHAVLLRKLREFQDMGYQIIFLIGDFTAKIGDPTGRSSARIPMTDNEIVNNFRNYQRQASLILDMDKVEVRYNSEWLAKMDFKDLIVLTSKITYAQMAQRADFKERIKKDQDLSIQEFLYPAMQGYDSVALKSDVELGGTDQKFNLLMGRQLQKRYDQEPQDIVTCPLLEGTDGKDKMSKSLDNYIGITEEPDQMFGKVMSIPDTSMHNYFELCTDVPMEEIKKMYVDIEAGKMNPRDAKMKLSFEITKIYHGEEGAERARDNFEKVFSRKEAPDEIKAVEAEVGERLVDFMVKSELSESKGDAKRKIEQGGVSIEGEAIKDPQYSLIESDSGKVLKVGKREFRKIEIS
jgi:tyrosyl-tRNA synthetase